MGEKQEYGRGKIAGELAVKVAEQGAHLDKINGSMEKVADRLGQLVQGQQRLEQRMEADDRTRIATAQALKDAEDARRKAEEETTIASDKQWSPLSRAAVALSGLGGFGVLLYYLIHG